ncbi:MAG: S8 family serine peptidase [Phycisphaerae bacterium]
MSLRSEVAFALLVGASLSNQTTTNADNDDAPYFYYYFDTARPLTLDVQRVAVLDSRDRAEDPPDLSLLGIDSEQIVQWPVHGWYLAATPPNLRSTPGIRSLVAHLTAQRDVAFVSPVLVGDDGGPIFITPDILVGFHGNVPAKEAEGIVTAADIGDLLERDWGNMPGVYRLRSTFRSGFEVLAAANELAQQAEVMFAEPDVVFTGRGSLIPNDGGFPQCWGLHNTGQSGGTVDMDMDAPEAWDTVLGDPLIKVVVIDVGVQQNHPDINQIAGTDTTSDPSTDGGPVNQFDNHGTPVAGCVSATINNNLGTVGVAPECVSASARTFIAINSSGNWTSSASWTVDSLTWAESIGARVTNNSNFYGFQSSSIANKYSTTRNGGMVHFASAGNDSSTFITYPASLSTVNAIAALNRFGNLAPFSNHGTGLAFSAPGQDIFTTDRTGSDGWVSGDYTFASGTSFASPYTAGVAALILSVWPALTTEGVEQILRTAAVDLGAAGYDVTYGWGFVNAAFSVSSMAPPVPATGEHAARKNRYTSFDPNNAGHNTAFQIEMTASLEFPASTGVMGWVGEPDANSVSRVVDLPFYSTTWPVPVHVGDCEILPAATYAIRATDDEVVFTAPLEVGTIAKPGARYYGDVVGTGTGDLPPLPGFTPPNRVVNVSDTQAYILTAQGTSTPSAHETWIDLHGLGPGTPPNYLINVADLQRILFGFEGQPYAQSPEHMDPTACP